MRLPDKIYNILKWAALVALPAIGLFYSAIAKIWGLPYGAEITATLDAAALLIGTLIGISQYNIKKGADAYEEGGNR